MKNRRIVVVGAGTSGAVVSMSLASRTDHEVIVVEPGMYSGLDDTSGFMDVLADSSLQAVHEVRLVAGGPMVPYIQGKCLGGGSSINGLLLTGEVPDVASGMTTMASMTQLGPMSHALRDAGGEPCRLWWNQGRWNPGRALMHLAHEGRIKVVSGDVEQIIHVSSTNIAVKLQEEIIEGDVVVMCAGALNTPRILMQSGFCEDNASIGRGLQDHPALTFAVDLLQLSSADFDAGVIRRGVTTVGQQYMIVAYERASWSEPELGLLSVMLMTPHSRGWVSGDGGAYEVNINMLEDQRDVTSMREALMALIDVATHSSFAAISHGVYADDEGTSVESLRTMTLSDLDSWIRRNLRAVSHVSSSCHQSVNALGALTKIRDVYIADASVLPCVPPDTPAGHVTMEARRIARELEGVVR
jgi:choline dehydrogenase-like flavoprotein